MTPSGPDTIDPSLPPLPVAAGQLVTLTATVDDTRYDGPEPSQDISSAELYATLPPWRGGTPIALAPADGAFDESVEEVTGTVDTSGLATGRHLLFVRGEDATNTFGAVSGEFLFVFDPAIAPTLEGTVSDATSGTPLGAALSIGPFRIAADPDSGFYSLQLPSGTYDVTAEAAGYVPETSEGVELEDFETVVLDFQLQPLIALLDDDVESGNVGWTAQAPWAVTDETSHSPTHSWTDSPGGNYANETDVSLTSPVFDLAAARATRLSFRHIYDFESGFDAGSVEISTDGASWTPVRSFSQEDQTTAWILEMIPLPMLDGQSAARIRFRVFTDVSLTRDGWHLDNIRLEAAVTAAIFADGFESGDTSAW